MIKGHTGRRREHAAIKIIQYKKKSRKGREKRGKSREAGKESRE